VSPELAESLDRLDALIAAAVTAARAAYGSPDPYRGLYITDEQVNEDLAAAPGEPRLAVPGVAGDALPRSVVERFGLSPFEADVVLIALAPEIDLRYERLFAYLNDDATRKRPIVDLVLTLLCGTRAARLAQRSIFAAGAPLLRHGLIRLGEESALLARSVRLDECVTRHILGDRSLDDELARAGRLVDAPAIGLDLVAIAAPDRAVVSAWLASAAMETRHDSRPLLLVGPRASGKRQAAEAIAAYLGAALLVARHDRAPTMAARLRLQAALSRAVLYVEAPSEDELEVLTAPGPARIVLGLDRGAGIRGLAQARLEAPPLEVRRARWREQLADHGLAIGAAAIERVAARFEIGIHQIDGAVEALARRAHAGESAPVEAGELLGAARSQCAPAPALAEEIVPRRGWTDIVLAPGALQQLRALCARVEHREQVLGAWGFGAKLANGLGTNALFAGPSGTGKTLAAEIIAAELGVPLFKVNLANLVSKYIGETEKNLQIIFEAAEESHAALFFDEADSLFGKRSAVRDSHDRYANLEISYLLQRMETYRGLAILATNLLQNLDEAFVRRLAFTIHFPLPGEKERERIWRNIWPSAAPLSGDVDAASLAAAHKLSGGAIRNAALAAAFLAQAEGRIGRQHVELAVMREYQKLGKRSNGVHVEAP
jgi:hypothetical protein